MIDMDNGMMFTSKTIVDYGSDFKFYVKQTTGSDEFNNKETNYYGVLDIVERNDSFYFVCVLLFKNDKTINFMYVDNHTNVFQYVSREKIENKKYKIKG